MWFRCACGHAEAYPFPVLVKMGIQPAGAVSIWASCCTECAPEEFCYPWGWVLDTGEEVGCLAGVDQIGTAAVGIQTAQLKRRAAATKAARR